MDCRPFDVEHWPRKEHFAHYLSGVPCTYSMTVKIDITGLLAQKQKLYPAMLFCLAKLINQHEEFRMVLDENNSLCVFDRMSPCYTVFHKETQTFSNIWTEYAESYTDFLKAYEKDLRDFGNVKRFEAKPDTPPNTFPVSMIPWESFEGFNLNLQNGYNYLTPIFTMGKYYEINGTYQLPFAMQVHHAVCDGFHACRFLGELRTLVKQNIF